MLNLGDYNKMNMAELKPLEVEEQTVDIPVTPRMKDDPIVEVIVTPVMCINGKAYLGICHVPQSTAGVLRHMMQSYKKGIEKIYDGTDHGTKHIGDIKG